MEYCIAIGSAVAGEIAKTLLAPITGSIGHLFSYNTDIKKLEKELKNLVDKKATEVDPRVREAERNLEIISASVIWWQKEVDDISQKGKEFLENDIEGIGKCFNGHCPDPKLPYSLSRKAKKMTKKVLALLQEAAKFGEIAHPGPPEKIGSIFITEGIRDFESRESIKNEVWEALKDDKLTMISICGTGGVGKTTMVKKLVQRIEREKLFDEVAMAVVSQTPNIKKIQCDIASCLSLKLCDESELTSAGKLRQSFINCGKRILLILDDVWSELDFERIGLPPRGERKGHTIMLTSRNKDVCNKLGSEKNFPMDVLTNEEAWDLFGEIASISIDQDLHQTATEIANECGGLPIAIVTVAKALKNKMRNIWDDALQQLKNSNLQGVSGDVFSKIELSYKFLEHEEAKLCFLLCSLFPEDFNIRVEDLVRYGMGLRLFKNVDNVHQARDRVYALIYELKESFLLLEGDHKWYDSVKMHDIVRDVAISIASRDEQWYMLQTDARIKEWQEKAGYKNCTAISLVCEKFIECPNDFECPKLELLQLLYDCQSQSLPNNIFEGMKELKVLALALGIPSLPPSLDVLKNLRTLRLEKFKSEEMHTVGTLVKLEILEIATCYVQELPGEIGLLKNLRLLDLRGVINLRYIPPGLLLGLSRLEELYVTDKFMMKWQSKEDGKTTNASLSELETHHITALEITVPKASILPKDLVFRNLIRFKIFIGHKFAYGSLIGRDSVNVLHLEGDASDIKGTEICAWLMRKAEVLNLIEVQNLKKVLYELEDYGFPDMKRTPFPECVGQEFLVDALEIVPRSREIQLSYFRNLREVNIRSCGKLKYFIPVSMARGLSQLHRILIAGCNEMEAVFHKTEVDDEIEFLELVALKLDHLPKFLGFVINPSLTSKDIEQPGTTQMDNRTETKYRQNQERTGLVEMISTLFSSLCPRLPNLQELNLDSCGLLTRLFPPSVAQQLVQLKKLIIRGCPEMEYIVAEPQEEEKNKRISKIVFPNLILLDFHELPKLVAFCPDSHISFDWLSLKELRLICCPEMKTTCVTIPSSSTLNKSFDQSDIIGGKKIMPPGGSFNRALVRRGQEQQNFSSRKDIYQPGTFQMNNENLHSSIEPVDMISILLPSNRLRLQNLQMLHLGACDSVKVIFPPSVAQQLVQLQYLNIRMCSAVEYIVAETEEQEKNKGTNKIVFPNLSLIELVRLPKLVAFCPDVHVSFACPLLKRLNLYSCPNMKTLCFAIPSSTVLNGSVDHIPSNNGLDGKPICSSIVRGVLRRGRKQKYVSRNEVLLIKNEEEDPSVSHIDEKREACYAFPSKLIEGFPNLENLRVENSDALEVIFSFEGLILQEYHTSTGILNSLKELQLSSLSKLMHIWFKIPLEVSAFRNLQVLKIISCDSLTYLFSPYLVKLLVMLQQIEVTSCQRMMEIIAKEDEEEQEANMDKIVFPQLTSLIFANLPNLKSFYSGTYALELPKLEKLKIRDENYPLIGDLNATVKKAMLTRILTHCKKTLRRTEDGQESEGHLSNIRVLEVEKCENLVNLIPFNFVECLQKLEKLSVCNCGSLMEMFEYQGMDTEGGNFVTFPCLEEVHLADLPKLMHIFNKIPENFIGFQKLIKLQFHTCGSLRNIFSVIVAKGLVQLQELDIKSCNMLEEIIVAEEDEKEDQLNKEKIVLPELRSLRLRNLPNLKSFYNGIYALEFPLLEILNFWVCNGMKSFSYGSLSMPKLKEVKINYGFHQLTGSPDLNATMSQLLYMKKEELDVTMEEPDTIFRRNYRRGLTKAYRGYRG